MKIKAFAIVGLLALTGCGQTCSYDKSGDMAEQSYAGGFAYESAPAPVSAPMAPPPPPPPPPPPGEPNAPAPEVAEQYIAYSYGLGLRLPVAAVEPVMQSHIAACEAAGTATCIVSNSNLNKQSDDYVAGTLYLRATPAWIETFQAGLDAQIADAKGEITDRNRQSEDLTRMILDTGARLDAQITLQTRLQGLLERRDGDLADLLAVERELARVTGDIESISANLKAMRLRVSLSNLSISYQPKQAAFSTGRSNPLGNAIGDFFYNLSEGLAGVITFFAMFLPWMFLIGLFIFIWLRLIWPWVRKKRGGV